MVLWHANPVFADLAWGAVPVPVVCAALVVGDLVVVVGVMEQVNGLAGHAYAPSIHTRPNNKINN